MYPARLFLNALGELEQKVASREEYDILAISRLLRLLLNDEQPLVHHVNRTHRSRLRFQCTEPYILNVPGLPIPTTMSSQDGFDPETSIPGNRRVEVDLAGLLAQVVAVHEGRKLSVLDVIKYEANVAGGVHAGEPRDTPAAALHAMNADLRIGGFAPSLRQLQAIGRVVLRGLSGLRERVAAEQASSK